MAPTRYYSSTNGGAKHTSPLVKRTLAQFYSNQEMIEERKNAKERKIVEKKIQIKLAIDKEKSAEEGKLNKVFMSVTEIHGGQDGNLTRSAFIFCYR